MVRWRSIRTRLTLLFFAITLAAVAFVLVYVTPQLESSLRAEKLKSLEAAANGYSGNLNQIDLSEKSLNSAVRAAAERTSTRVTLLAVRGARPPETYVISDSNQETDISDLGFLVADSAVAERGVVTGTATSDDGPIGQAAKPLFSGKRIRRVVVFSAPMADVIDNVALIRRQILIAGGLGLLLALVAGTLVARAISRRVSVLEEGADRVARGDFSTRFPVGTDDELGQLARALEEMRAQLAQLDSARKRFIATASHELRTPIFSLGGFLELIEDEDLDEDTRRAFVRQVRAQTFRLQKLATDLLDLSRLEAGSLELRQERVDVALLARAVASEFAPALVAHESRLELEMGTGEIRAYCDPERVAQVLRILIDNALTHTPRGTAVVVRAGRQNGTLELAVEDHGPGIDHDALPRVFEPFYTSDDAQGSGLGLAIARELAERMTGRLDVETGPGATTFALQLPA
jgi:two-component system, OmpR family, sensor kinase